MTFFIWWPLPIAASCLAWFSYVAMISATVCETLGFCRRVLMLGRIPSELNCQCWWLMIGWPTAMCEWFALTARSRCWSTWNVISGGSYDGVCTFGSQGMRQSILWNLQTMDMTCRQLWPRTQGRWTVGSRLTLFTRVWFVWPIICKYARMALNLSASGWSLWCNSGGTALKVSNCGSCKNRPIHVQNFLGSFLCSSFPDCWRCPCFLIGWGLLILFRHLLFSR